MKKIVKILTLALSVVLILGAMAFAVSAADDASLKRNVAWSTDFEANAVGVYGTKTAVTTVAPPWGPSTLTITGGRPGAFTISQGGIANNKYFTFSHTAPGVTTNSTGVINWNQIDTESKANGYAHSFDDVDYYVIDVDLMTPYANNYATSISFGFLAYQYGSASNNDYALGAWNGGQFVVIDKVEGKFVLKTPAGDMVDLPSAAGEWNHITMAMKVDHTTKANGDFNFSKNTLTIWVNGEKKLDQAIAGIPASYDKKANVHQGNPDHISMKHFRVSFPGTYNADPESITAIDNVVVSRYLAGTSATLDQIGNYVYQDGANRPLGEKKAAITVGGETKEYDRIGDAFAALVDGAEMQLYTDVTDTFVVNNTVTIKFVDGEKTYDISGITSSSFLKDTSVEGQITFKEAGNAEVNIYWADCDHEEYCGDVSDALLAENHPYYVEGTAIVGNTPIHPNADLYPAATYYKDGKLYNFLGWSYESGATEADELVPVTEEDRDYGVSLFPVYEAVEVGFYVVRGEKINYYGTDKSLVTVISEEVRSGDTVVLVTDIEITSNININKGFTLDLNGHTLSLVCYTQNTWKNGATIAWGPKKQMFDVNTSETFTLTSSQPGGMLAEHAFIKNLNEDGSTFKNPTIGGMGVFYVGASGQGHDIVIDGENLSVFCCDLYVNRTTTIGGKLTINGGYYCNSAADQQGLIYVYYANSNIVTFEAKDAFFTSSVGRHLINMFEGAYVEGTFTNCTFYGPTTGSQIVSNSQKTTLTFNDCDIFCKIAANAGTINLGIGTKVQELGNAVAAPGASVIAASGSQTIDYKTIPLTTSEDKLSFAPDAYKITSTTKTVSYAAEAVKEIKFITATWLDMEGNLLATSQVPENSVATIPNAATYQVDNWLATKYTKWTVDGVTESDLAVGTENVTFKAMCAPVVDENTEYVASMLGFKINFNYSTHWIYQGYVLVEDGVQIDYFDMNGTSRGLTSYVLIKNEKHIVGKIWPGNNDILTNLTATVKFTIDGVQYTQNFKSSLVEYAEYVINNIPDATEAEKTMVADAVNYPYQVSKYLKASYTNERAEKFLETYAEYLSTYTDYANDYVIPKAEGESIYNYVASLSYNVTGTHDINIKIVPTEAGKAEGITITATYLWWQEGNCALTKGSDGSYTTATRQTIKNLRGGLILTVKNAEGTVLSKEAVNVADVITAAKAQGANTAVYEAIYNLASSASKFKAYK